MFVRMCIERYAMWFLFPINGKAKKTQKNEFKAMKICKFVKQRDKITRLLTFIKYINEAMSHRIVIFYVFFQELKKNVRYVCLSS